MVFGPELPHAGPIRMATKRAAMAVEILNVGTNMAHICRGWARYFDVRTAIVFAPRKQLATAYSTSEPGRGWDRENHAWPGLGSAAAQGVLLIFSMTMPCDGTLVAV